MNLTDTAWSCQRCGAAFFSTPPEHGLCAQCIRDLETLARALQSQAPTCMECGGPVCPDCGQSVTVVVPVPMPPLVLATNGGHARGVNGDGG